MPLSNAMHESSMNHPPEADEFEKAGLTPAGCEVVGAPRVEEAAVSMECVLERVLKLGTDHLVIGKMVRFHVREELYENGRIDIAKRTIRVGRFFPSTKLCSECGRLNPNLTLSGRAWLCGCGAQHDRDLNAAKNILAEGMRLLAAGQTESPINARGGPVSLPTGSTA